MSRVSYLLLAAGCLIACESKTTKQGAGGPEGDRAATAENQQQAAGRIGAHGMIVAGSSNAAFVSHIPMLMGGVHDVQMVAAGSFTTLTATPVPASFSESLHSFLPDKMSLDAVRLGSLTEFPGTLFLGNFEAGGRPITRARFVVSSVLHQRVLEPAATQAELTYFVFGPRNRALAVHRISGSPSFDEVLRVELTGDGAPTDAELAAGIDVHVNGTPDDVSARLSGSSEPKPAAAGSRSFNVKSAGALSCLEGPEFASPCP